MEYFKEKKSQTETLLVFIKPPSCKNQSWLSHTLDEELKIKAYLSRLKDLFNDISDIDNTIYYINDIKNAFRVFKDAEPGFTFRQQSGLSSGENISNAFVEGFKEFESVIMIYSDVPNINSSLVHYYFEKLKSFDMVLGPLSFESFYLIGFTKRGFTKDFFAVLQGKNNGLVQINDKIKALNINCFQGPVLQKVDQFNKLVYKPFEPNKEDSELDVCFVPAFMESH